jgi:hypothetical protein
MRVRWPTHSLYCCLQGENVVAAQDEQSFVRNYDDLKAHFESVPSLLDKLAGTAEGELRPGATGWLILPRGTVGLARPW